jgi:hypothetical protein
MEDGCMKKAVVFLFLALVTIYACAAQNVNISQRIVGTWEIINSGSHVYEYSFADGKLELPPTLKTWVFSAAGKLTIDGLETIYGVTDTRLAYLWPENGRSAGPNASVQLRAFDISISADGKTLIIGNSYLLRKK